MPSETVPIHANSLITLFVDECWNTILNKRIQNKDALAPITTYLQ